jgi:asparaginyl-tRNA synthetase
MQTNETSQESRAKEASVSHIQAFDDQDVIIKGWLHNKRSSGNIHFLLIRDGSGTIQCIVEKKKVPENVFKIFDELTQESSLIITGRVRKEPRSPIGFEITVSDIEVVHISQPYPITPKEHGTAFLMDNRHLWLRSSKQRAIQKIRHTIVMAIYDYFNSRDFVLINTPILTANAVEGTTSLFEVDFFGEKAYLSQSGQLYVEAACMAFKNVYTFGPTFRAEKSKTRKHLNEFWMVEPEMAFGTLDDVFTHEEGLIMHLVNEVLQKNQEDLAVLERNVDTLKKIKPPFPKITYSDAIVTLQKKGSPVKWGDDLGADEETLLAQDYDTPLFVHRYPKAMTSFYMVPDPDDDKLTMNADLLGPEGYGEIIGGGSERISSLELLEQRIDEHKLPRHVFEWYLDLRRYGSVPHCGFGMGLERAVAWLSGAAHVRETIPFPRMYYRLTP